LRPGGQQEILIPASQEREKGRRRAGGPFSFIQSSKDQNGRPPSSSPPSSSAAGAATPNSALMPSVSASSKPSHVSGSARSAASSVPGIAPKLEPPCAVRTTG